MADVTAGMDPNFELKSGTVAYITTGKTDTIMIDRVVTKGLNIGGFENNPLVLQQSQLY